jgi:hypothetical protein
MFTIRPFDPADAADVAYVQHARHAMLEAISLPVAGGRVPLPFAQYLIACDGDRRIGMCEAAMLHAAYPSRDAVPYRELLRGLDFHRLASIRSIWVEPDQRGGAVFVALYTRACRLLHAEGAELAVFAAVTSAPALARLYERQGALRLGVHDDAVILALDLDEVSRRAA